MSYADSLLANGERVLYRARQHWLAPVSDSVRPALILLGGLVFFLLAVWPPLGFMTPLLALLGLILIVVAIVWIAIVHLTWRAQEYLITNRRVLKVEGLLDKKSGDSSLDKINDAVLRQGLLARLFKYGDLDILTANETAIDRYEMLNRVVDFKKAMLNAKNVLEDGGRGADSAPAAAATGSGATDDVSAKLDKLADLRDKGKITQADYDKKKAELLDRM